MSLSAKIEDWVKKILPSPFSIALLLTLLVFVFSVFWGDFHSDNSNLIAATESWYKGLWQINLMRFLVQMMLMLVLGHILALSSIANTLLNKLLIPIKNGNQAIVMVAIVSILMGLFNWGLGLIISAIFARKVGEYAQENSIKLNYPLLVATAYVSLMVWHGGISGSAPAKVAESNHLKNLMNGIIPSQEISLLPISISYRETIFSDMNLVSIFLLILVIPLAVYFLSKKTKKAVPKLIENIKKEVHNENNPQGAEKFDYSPWISKTIGILLFCVWINISFFKQKEFLSTINPDSINLVLLALGILAHKNISQFLIAGQKAIGGATGILIQFPLYFGIMGLMKDSGMVHQLSDFFVSISNKTTLPIFTLISAGIVNIFVPSGGGQWGVQGPMMIKASLDLGVPYAKTVMALAYGDQLTNMLQPFWALPLLGICKLKASQILPYTFFLFLLGVLIFGTVILLF
jgi:short-chain fatty acids transporter